MKRPGHNCRVSPIGCGTTWGIRDRRRGGPACRMLEGPKNPKGRIGTAIGNITGDWVLI